MRFLEIANLFETLENKSKRLEKILLLRDFFLKNPKETPLIFDLISGNYQRENDKRSIGISLKTIFSVIGFVSSRNDETIEKYFNKIGDVGECSVNFINENKQSSFQDAKLYLSDIIEAFRKISKTIGNNKNKNKKEILGNLFLRANSKEEYKFLARLLIDDLRIGVSEGVLREANVISIFPNILQIQMICSKCDYLNLNLKKCLNCNQDLSDKNQEEIVLKKYEIIEVTTPKEIISLEEFIGERDTNENLKFILRLDKKSKIIKAENPRNLYNLFLEMFEKKYNTLNSFIEINQELKNNLQEIIKVEAILGKPLKSMLGVRTNDIESSFKVSGKPGFMDYKYDGLRVQIHNNKGVVSLFSRNLDNITKQFPEVVEFIKNNFSDVSFILDSECVGYDFEKMQFLPFQMLSKRILAKNNEEVNHIKIVVKAFDIFYIEEKTIIDEPYSKRRELLENLFLDKNLVQEMNYDLEKIKKN